MIINFINNIILIGFKNCGKTTLGKSLALKLNFSFLDIDQIIEKEEGRSVRQIFSKQGEAAFRKIEKKTICSLKANLKADLSSKQIKSYVLATGGGTVLDAENVKILRTLGTLVYLKVPKEVLKERMLSKKNSKASLPSFLDPSNIEASFENMYNERVQIYEQIADFTISTQELLLAEFHQY